MRSVLYKDLRSVEITFVGRNIIQAINSYAVPVMRYVGGFIQGSLLMCLLESN